MFAAQWMAEDLLPRRWKDHGIKPTYLTHHHQTEFTCELFYDKTYGLKNWAVEWVGRQRREVLTCRVRISACDWYKLPTWPIYLICWVNIWLPLSLFKVQALPQLVGLGYFISRRQSIGPP